MSGAPAPATRLPLLRAWWIADRAGLLRAVALVLSAVSFVLLLPGLMKDGGAGFVVNNVVIHLYVLAWLMLATVGVRSIGAREVLTAYFLGTFLVPVVVFVPLIPIVRWLGTGNPALATWWVPPFEEAGLLAGTMLIAWRLCRRPGRLPGVLDLMVVGWSVGAGLAIHEDGMYRRFLPGFDEGGSLAGAFGGPYGAIFPTFYESPWGYLTTYHAGSGAIFGITVGLVVMFRHRLPLVRWIVPVVWLHATIDHAVYNDHLWNDTSPLRFLTANGHLQPVVLLLAVPALLAFEHWRRRRVDLGLPGFGWAGVREAARRGRGFLPKATRLLAYGQYHRARNAALAATWARPGEPAPAIDRIEAWGRIAFAPASPEAAERSTGEVPSETGHAAPPPPARRAEPPAPRAESPAPAGPPDGSAPSSDDDASAQPES